MEDMNVNNVSLELEEDYIARPVEEEHVPTLTELRARKEKLFIKAHSAILRACWGSSSRAPKQ